MKSLSGANITNIAGTFQNPDVLVEMAGISKQWSTKTRATYETRIVDISPIIQLINPLGGIASQSDFSITIQQEPTSQFIQDQDVDNETVDVYLQYGSDAKIKIISGKLDRWEYKAGKLILHCIANTELLDKLLPIEQIDSGLGFLNIPAHNIGKWTPITIGTHDRAFGYLVDHTPGAEKVKFNAAVSSHDGIDAPSSMSIYIGQAKEFLTVANALTENADGTLRFVGSAGSLEINLVMIPIEGTDQDFTAINGGMQNTVRTIDEDFGTNAEARAIAAFGSSEEVWAQVRIRDFPFPESIVVRTNELYILIDLDRTDASGAGADVTPAPINPGTSTVEICEAAIELAEDTWPGATAALVKTVLADGDAAFDNINEVTDSVTALPLSTADYAAKIGLDLDGDGTAETLPVSRLSLRNLTLRYIQEWKSGGAQPSSLKIHEFRLRVDMDAPVQTQDYYGDLEGYNDDGSGTYTGSASVVIENPADAVWFMLDQLLSVASINTGSFTTARTALGNFVIAGQILKRTNARAVLDELCRQSRLKLFLDFNDQWAIKAFTLPGTADRELKQLSGDFITEGGVEGEIVSVTQTSLDELYNQFEILYAWNEATKAFDKKLVLDETTNGYVGEVLTDSQSRYGITRKLTVNAGWLRTDNAALSHGMYLVQQHAERKRIAKWRTSFNGVDLEIGDMIQLTHPDMFVTEDTTVFAGYRDTSLTTIKAGFTDPDTSAVIKCGAKVQQFEGRHRYEIFEIETIPMDGTVLFTGRQADWSYAGLSDPLVA